MSNRDAKTEDDFFLGFPSLWNLVALYLWHWNLSIWLNGLIVGILAGAVLLPIRFIYPSKTKFLRRFTMASMAIWGILILLSLVSQASWAQRCFDYSNWFALYYLGLSLILHIQQGRKSK